MVRIRRSALAIGTAGLLSLFTVLGSAASAMTTAGGVKGDPQPELKPFVIGASGYGGGSAAMEPDGALVVARGATTANGVGKIVVCVLNRGANKCSSTVTLNPFSPDDLFGTPEVFVPSANHVVVLMDACCDSNPAGSDLLFSSTNGGRTFSAPVRVGTLGVSAAALIRGDIVFTASSANGAEVESLPVGASGPPAATAIATAKEAFDVAVGSYKGGALIASDFLGTTDYTTYVAYAKAGANFNASASYHRVATFAHEQLIAMSGDALLTTKTTGKPVLELRLFNGTSFSAPHVVPGSATGFEGGIGTWSTIDQDPSGRVHVFDESEFFSTGYLMYEESTSTGSSWTSPVDLGNAINSTSFGAALDSHGSGLVVGTDADEPAWGYPVLAAQGASFSLKSSTITKGSTTIGSGNGSPAAPGRVVDLQVERSGLWYTVATTREASGGKFSFTIKGTSAGTFDYRAVVADLAGYVMYGYSPARALKVTS
jgi:hypothetical protein